MKLAISDQEILNHMVEEIQAIIVLTKENMSRMLIETKYRVGDVVVNCSLYKKHGKNQSEFYRLIGEQIGAKEDTLADCVKLYESFPEQEPAKLADELFVKHGSWREVRKALYGEPNAVRKIERSICRRCDLHCPR